MWRKKDDFITSEGLHYEKYFIISEIKYQSAEMHDQIQFQQFTAADPTVPAARFDAQETLDSMAAAVSSYTYSELSWYDHHPSLNRWLKTKDLTDISKDAINELIRLLGDAAGTVKNSTINLVSLLLQREASAALIVEGTSNWGKFQ